MPATPLPAALAYTRIQSQGYTSYSADGVSRGRVSLVGPEDLERAADYETMQAWQDVSQIVRLTPILVPVTPDPLAGLREGAATLRADVLLLYTVDTRFTVDELPIGPLGVVTLGMVPNKSAKVASTVSVAFFDVRTGFCYGTAEGSARDDQLANVWSTQQAMDDCRRRVERQALEQALVESGVVWRLAMEQHRTAVAGRDPGASSASARAASP